MTSEGSPKPSIQVSQAPDPITPITGGRSAFSPPAKPRRRIPPNFILVTDAIDEIAERKGIERDAAKSILHDDLSLKKIGAFCFCENGQRIAIIPSSWDSSTAHKVFEPESPNGPGHGVFSCERYGIVEGLAVIFKPDLMAADVCMSPAFIPLREVAQAYLGLLPDKDGHIRFDVPDRDGRIPAFLRSVRQRALIGDVNVRGREDCEEETEIITPSSNVRAQYWKKAELDVTEFLLNAGRAITKSTLRDSVTIYCDLHLQQDQAEGFWPPRPSDGPPTVALAGPRDAKAVGAEDAPSIAQQPGSQTNGGESESVEEKPIPGPVNHVEWAAGAAFPARRAMRHVATAQDEGDFREYAKQLYDISGVGPSHTEAEEFARKKYVKGAREWARAMIETLPPEHRRERGSGNPLFLAAPAAALG